MTIGLWRKDRAADRRLRRKAGPAVVAALALLAAACSGSGHSTSQVSPAANAKTRAATPRAAVAVPGVKITPANGADADPSAGITVTATGGTLQNVTVRTSGDAVSGRLSQDSKVWRSQWALDVSQTYTVTATASAKRRRRRHRHEHLPHADAEPDVHHRDPRGLRPDLRRRDTDHPVLQPADCRQGRGRAGAADHDVEASSRRVVLGRPLQHGPHLRLLPPA